MAIFVIGSCFPVAQYMTELSAKLAIEITIGNTNDIDRTEDDIANQSTVREEYRGWSESNESFDKVCRAPPASL